MYCIDEISLAWNVTLGLKPPVEHFKYKISPLNNVMHDRNMLCIQVRNFMHFNSTYQSLWQQPTVATSSTTASVGAAISNLESRLAAASSAESSTPAAVVPSLNSIEHTSSIPTAVVSGALGVAVEDGPASTVQRRGSHAQDVSMTSTAEENVIHAATPASGPTSFDGAATSTPRTEHVNDQVLGQKKHQIFPNCSVLFRLFNLICGCPKYYN